MALRVLLLDDEADLTIPVCEFLNAQGFIAEYTNDPLSIFDRIKDFRPDILILDNHMPEKTGMEVLKDIRVNPKTLNLPVIMVTATDREENEIISFENGIDDFILKPFDLKVLEARIKAIHSRIQNNSTILKINELTLNLSGQTLHIDEKEVKLTKTEFNFLRALMSKADTALDRETLYKDALGKSFVSNRAVDVHIVSLRNKLKDHAKYIKTIYGFGYKFAS